MKKIVTNNDYNKWSIELAGGFNKPQDPWLPGYSTSTQVLMLFGS
jgi:OOP family OmpA-OmpF porin